MRGQNALLEKENAFSPRRLRLLVAGEGAAYCRSGGRLETFADRSGRAV